MKRELFNRFLHFQLLLVIVIGLTTIIGTAGCGGGGDNDDDKPLNNSFVIPFKTITIDGNYSDWAESDRIYIDSEGNDWRDASGQSIKVLYIAQDENYIYLRFVLNGPMPSWGTKNLGYKFGSFIHITVRLLDDEEDYSYWNEY